MEYLCTGGNCVYLVDTRYDEAYIFGDMCFPVGLTTASMALLQSYTQTECKIISIVSGLTDNRCELFYDGEVAVIPDSGRNVYARLKDRLESIYYMPFRVAHPERVSQYLLPVEVESVSKSILESILGRLEWNKLEI